MAEPFSVIATIAGFAAVALHSARKTKDLIDSVVDAPKTIADIAVNVTLLEPILSGLGTSLADYERTRPDAKVVESLRWLGPPLQECTTTLDELKIVIGPFIRLHDGGSRRWHRGILRWKFTEKKVQSHLRTLETFKASLQLALAAFAMVVERSSSQIICTEIRELREVVLIDASETATHVPSESGPVSVPGTSITDDGFLIRRYFLGMPPQYLLSPSRPPTPRALSCVEIYDIWDLVENFHSEVGIVIMFAMLVARAQWSRFTQTSGGFVRKKSTRRAVMIITIVRVIYLPFYLQLMLAPLLAITVWPRYFSAPPEVSLSPPRKSFRAGVITALGILALSIVLLILTLTY